MSKKAFVAGINNFNGDIPHLQGCINDTIAMQELLIKYFGFQTIKYCHLSFFFAKIWSELCSK